MEKVIVKENIKYIGVDDKDLDLFESQYIIPNGISYNSYLIKDEKNVVMDTVDKRKTSQWIKNLEEALEGEKVDYLVISHLEPDHSSNIALLCEKYPDMKLIGNNKTFAFLPQFFDIPNLEERKIEKDRFTVAEKIAQIKDSLLIKDRFKFSDLFEADYSKSEIINTFLALLELLKNQLIKVEQTSTFGDIDIFKREDKVNNG